MVSERNVEVLVLDHLDVPDRMIGGLGLTSRDPDGYLIMRNCSSSL
jgi:hypothetical protein